MTIERIWAMPNKNTFTIKPIKELLTIEMTKGKWVDPFANDSKLATITNDLNPRFQTDYHIDALEFLRMFEANSIDGVLYDPPYSLEQVRLHYENYGLNVTDKKAGKMFNARHKQEIGRIVKVGGKVISFGWNSGGIGKKYGFEMQKILLVPHGGHRNDTICTVETKVKEVK